jgi:hypothetical protein
VPPGGSSFGHDGISETGGGIESSTRKGSHATLKGGGNVSDGREEREERERRIEQEKRENCEDQVNRDDLEEWKPERVDS